MTTRLPVVGSTAASTSFCTAQLDGPGRLTIYFDGNGKVTAGNGTMHSPRANAFSLPAQAVTDARLTAANPDHAFRTSSISTGTSMVLDSADDYKDCPGSTRVCRASCYVGPLSKAQADLYALYEHNRATLDIILDGCELHPQHGMIFTELAAAWVQEFTSWIVDNASAGFRWHVSGDVISMEYVHFIAAVVKASAPVLHWIYTRSFDYLAPLAAVSTLRGGNLALNLSCDADNIEDARIHADLHGTLDDGGWFQRLRLCYLTTDGNLPADLDDGDITFPDYNLRPRQYPTLAESPWWQTLTPLQKKTVCVVDAHGKAENRRCGPCDRCLK